MVKRAVGFESLLSPTRQAFASVPAEVHALLRQHPDEADSIRTALIEALEMEASYREGLERSGQQMTEAFSDYWSNLMWAVGTLRDPRATKGLLGGIDTGGIAVNALADLCPASADALIERTRQPDRTFHGEVIRQRQAAMSALAACMKRVQSMNSGPQAVAKIRKAALAAADDPDPGMRDSAVGVLFYFRSDVDVRAKLAQVAASDTYQESYEAFQPHPGQFTVREAARAALNAPDNDDSYYFVMRSANGFECQVQKGSERPKTDRYIGPEVSGPEEARHMLCSHVDADKINPDLCWSVAPAGNCR
jgi:hypothetical protein